MASINKKENTKESIIRLADEAKIQINQNTYLLEIMEIFKQQISMVKNIITNSSINSNQNNKSIYDLSLAYKENLSSLNSKLKEEINKNIKKQENNNNLISKNLTEASQTLSQIKEDNFILKNTINKYDYIIQNLKESIDSSRKHDLFREPKRETEIELKESKNVFLIYNLECQQKMLLFCREYAKNKYRNVKKVSKINAYKNNISVLKNIIKYYATKLYGDEIRIIKTLNEVNKNPKKNNKNKNKNYVNIKKRIETTPGGKKEFGKIKKINFIKNNIFFSINENKKENDNNSNSNELSNSKNNSNDNSFNKTSLLFENIYKNENDDNDNNKNKENNSARKKINILKIDELLDIENIEIKDENIIDEELNSDDEVFFEKKVKPKKKISIDFLPNIKKSIPTINLTQIEFNKLKVINEADAYSLQKRKFEHGNIYGKIKNLKKQIGCLEKRISKNKKKLEVIHTFIEDVKYNYKLLRPIKVQTSAAGNPVNYIREKLLNIVEETISQTEKKENKLLTDNKNTGKTAVEEGEENDEELVGSDYSDEDEYLDNLENKGYESDNKENISNNNNKNNVINVEKSKKINRKIKQKDNGIKSNLISKFESDEKDNKKDKILNNKVKFDDIFEENNVIVQSK